MSIADASRLEPAIFPLESLAFLVAELLFLLVLAFLLFLAAPVDLVPLAFTGIANQKCATTKQETQCQNDLNHKTHSIGFGDCKNEVCQ